MCCIKNINLNRIVKFFLFAIICFLFIGVVVFFPYKFLNISNISLEKKLLNKLFINNFFYKTNVIVNAQDCNDEINEAVVEYKLFNLFNIKKLKINLIEKESKFLVGGNCIGFNLFSKGAIIVGGSYVATGNGLVNPIQNSGLEIGDIIIKIDNVDIQNIENITSYLNNLDTQKNIVLTVNRKNELLQFEIRPEKDIQTNSYKLGLWLKDSIVGIGTLTYVRNDNNTFGALGHPINTENSSNGFLVESGELYSCTVLGVKEAKNNIAGQLLGTFSLSQKKQGDISLNNKFGIYGKIDPDSEFLDNKIIEVANREEIKHGKAKILSCVNGNDVEEFDIEIIKTNYQTGKNDKNMVIRVIDKKLLQLTGGIVQGMSGSPIIQNGKLIGAVTHVFLNDASKGFALYIDNMIDQYVV